MKFLVSLGALIFVSTELLSALDALTRPALFGLWLTVAAILIAKWRPPFAVTGGAWLWVAAGSALAALAVALATPPNTVDAMTYHMPRIAMWLQNKSVAYFPTTNPIQLFMTPGAEYIQLHFVGLFGSERFASVAHALAYAASGFASAQLAARAGGSPLAQVLAAVFCLSIPQGALAASGAKNDWFLVLWLLVSACFFIDFVRTPTFARATWLGLPVGLALSTKGTAFVFLPCVPILWPLASPRPPISHLVRRVAPAAFIPLLFLLPTLGRNQHFMGSPLVAPHAMRQHERYENSRHAPDVLVSNLVRNLALHTPGVPVIQRSVEQWANDIFNVLHIDPNDEATTWPATRFHIPKAEAHEATAGNTLHLILALTAGALLIFHRFRDAKTAALATLLVALGLSFCFFLRWQPWHSRLHLPIFAFGSTLIALQLSRIRPVWICHAVTALCLLWTMNLAVRNVSRPALGGRSVFVRPAEELLFFDRSIHYESYTQAVSFVKRTGCREIGLDSTKYQYDYPFFSMLGVLDHERTLRYTGVANPSTKYRKPEWPEPCAVICLECPVEPAKRGFDSATQFPGLVIYTRSPVPSQGSQRKQR
jgi:hypothetical protein